jgi:tyrosine-protein kinase Etk/Wzc
MTLLVEHLDARPGAQFTVRLLGKARVIEQLRSTIAVTEEGKQSGIIVVKLQGADPELISKTLNEIGQQYISQNFSRKTEEAQKALAFLNAQLPALKIELERAEAEYSLFRTRHGTVNLTEEGRIALQQSATAKGKRQELLQRRAELQARLSDRHPLIIAIDDQLKQIGDAIDAGTSQTEALPILEQEEVRLAREVKASTELYTSLSTTAEQLRVLSASKTSNVHLVDMAIAPDAPLKPNRPVIISTGIIAGLFAGVILACLRKALFGAIDDPKKVEQMLGARIVHATIPHSHDQAASLKRMRGKAGPLPLLAQTMPEDPAVEALRGFRTALRFSMPRFKNNIVMLAGPTSQVGKSFIAANLAAVMASSGKKVLLIDADVRNGNLHRYVGALHRPGLCDAMRGISSMQAIIRRNVIDKVDFIPTGELPAGQSDYFMHGNLGALLDAVKADYDLVLIDTPPLLELSDGLLIGEYASAIFLVVRAGLSSQADINESIKRLAQAGLSSEGILFNDVKLRLGAYGHRVRYGKTRLIEGQVPEAS